MSKAFYEQIQKTFTLYENQIRYGPESCDEIQNFIRHLKPIRNYFQPSDDNNNDLIEDNFGPEITRAKLTTTPGRKEEFNNNNKNKNVNDNRFKVKLEYSGDNDDVDNYENDLTGYSMKLNHYLNEHSKETDKELIYSNGKYNKETMNKHSLK